MGKEGAVVISYCFVIIPVLMLSLFLIVYFNTPRRSMRKFMTTPFPFPLVQMARTFLFLYVYTLPFALLEDASDAVAHVLVIFLVTYGFVGLETVSIELDDPFGNDENDFDNLGMALVSFSYTSINVCVCVSL